MKIRCWSISYGTCSSQHFMIDRCLFFIVFSYFLMLPSSFALYSRHYISFPISSVFTFGKYDNTYEMWCFDAFHLFTPLDLLWIPLNAARFFHLSKLVKYLDSLSCAALCRIEILLEKKTRGKKENEKKHRIIRSKFPNSTVYDQTVSSIPQIIQRTLDFQFGLCE